MKFNRIINKIPAVPRTTLYPLTCIGHRSGEKCRLAVSAQWVWVTPLCAAAVPTVFCSIVACNTQQLFAIIRTHLP